VVPPELGPADAGRDDQSTSPIATRRAAMTRSDALLAALLLAGSLALAVGYLGDSYDDAFITYRYARNLAAHGELSYNLGERVLGTTAPGYALLLGALSAALPVAPHLWGTLLGVAALAATVLLVRRMLRDAEASGAVGATTARLVPWLYAAALVPCRWNVELLGAETLPVLALGAATLHLLLQRRRPVAAGFLAAIAFAFRPDAALLPAAALPWAWRRAGGRSEALRFALTAAAIAGGFALYLALAFDSPVPSTLAGKQGEASTFAYSASEWRWLRRSYPAPVAVALPLLAAAGLAAALRSGRGPQARFGDEGGDRELAGRRETSGNPSGVAGDVVAAAATWVVVHELSYRALRVPFAPWYHVLTLAALLVAAAGGVAAIGAALARRLGGASPRRPALAALLATLLWTPFVAPQLVWLARQRGAPPDPRQQAYRAVAEVLQQRGDDGKLAAAVEIGVIGYWSDARILDLGGLVTPAAREARAAGRLGQLVAARAPDYLVDMSLFRRAYPVLRHPPVRRRYRAIATISKELNPGVTIRVLERRRGPSSPRLP
jgi:hypothetical protein